MGEATPACVDAAIHGRRTTKEYRSEPLARALVDELLELARWAPNHRMTEPWRFRVLGPSALAALKDAAGPEAGAKLDRAPTLIVASAVPSPLPLHAAEDVQAAACAVYAVLLGAHARGIASYWRTPGVLRPEQGRDAVGVPAGEVVLGLIHLGYPAHDEAPDVPERGPLDAYVTHLD